MRQRRLSPNKLAACVDLARPILIEVATCKEGRITYTDLLIDMGRKPGMPYIGQVLNRIAELEREAHHPKLTAVVVRVDTGEVGGGFFGLPKTPPDLLRTSPKEWRNPKLNGADRDYWHKQLKCVYEHWQSFNP